MRAGLGPATLRTVSWGLSASAVPMPTTTRVDERAQPVQMGEAGGAVDVFEPALDGGDTAVERLADLADHHEVVHGAGAQRAEQGVPRRRQAARPCGTPAARRTSRRCRYRPIRTSP